MDALSRSPAAITNPRHVAAASTSRRRGLSCLGRHAKNEVPGGGAFLGCRGIGQRRGGVVKSEIKNAGGQRDRAAIDFSDPGWKPKFQRDFESRFDLPHLKDVFPDAVPIPSTFCLRMRTPTEDFADGYPSDEKWHGYINNSDRVLLKVL